MSQEDVELVRRLLEPYEHADIAATSRRGAGRRWAWDWARRASLAVSGWLAPSSRALLLLSIQIGDERHLDHAGQRHGLIDCGVLDATDERRRQVDVELLLALGVLRHSVMLAS